MGASASTAVAALAQELELLTGEVEFVDIDGNAGEEAWQRLFRTIHRLPPKPHLRPSDVEQATRALCLRMTGNNAKTKNLHRLVRYAVRLLGKRPLQLQQQEPGPRSGGGGGGGSGSGGGTSETSTTAAAQDGPPPPAPVEEDPTTLLNALYLVRVFVKHLIETSDARQLLEQLQSDAERGTAHAETATLLVHALMDYCSQQPVGPDLFAIYKESLELLLILMSTRMYRSFTTAATEVDHPFLDACLRYRRANRFARAMLLNYISAPQPAPATPASAALLSPRLSTLATTSASSGLLSRWGWPSLFSSQSSDSISTTTADQAATRSLSQLSLFVLLGLAIHTTPSSSPTLHTNLFRNQLATFRDLYYESGAEGEGEEPRDRASSDECTEDDHFCLSYSQLFDALPLDLSDDSILLLYMLIHTNKQFLSYLLARSDVDALLLPLMEALYGLEDQTQEQRAYMILVCLVIITQDKLFNQNIHHLMLGEVTWYKERYMRDISLGSLLVVVLVRTVHVTLSKLRDSYLPVHCLAALGNMSMYLDNLHPYAAHRLIKLFEMYSRRHTSLLRRINKVQDENSSTAAQQPALTRSSSFLMLPVADNDVKLALENAESCLEVVLEILNSCLTNALRANPQLSYALLHDKALFPPYAQHPRFSHLLHNIQAVLDHFEFLLTQAEITEYTTEAILEVIQRGSLTWQSREYPLQFTYEEEDNAHHFFAPFLWNTIRQGTADFGWSSANMQLAALLPPPSAGHSTDIATSHLGD